MYLNSFFFGDTDRYVYPHEVFIEKGLSRVDFAPITIFYGGNGSGKSTILNVIARTIGVRGVSLGNTSDFFRSYIQLCDYNYTGQITQRTAHFIRSEDIMEGILMIRQENQRITEQTYKEAKVLDDFVEGLGDRFRDPDSMEPWEKNLIPRLEDGHKLLLSLYSRAQQCSNGESAMKYFKTSLVRNALFFLDEPENSLDAVFQQKIAAMIEDHVKNKNGQFIIATHSPFLMAMEGAKVIDLDSYPATERPWYELPNMVAYFDFFHKHAEKFQSK
jgi:predicted ATPase